MTNLISARSLFFFLALLTSSNLTFGDSSKPDSTNLSHTEMVDLQELLLISGYPPGGTGGNYTSHTLAAARLYKNDPTIEAEHLHSVLKDLRIQHSKSLLVRRAEYEKSQKAISDKLDEFGDFKEESEKLGPLNERIAKLEEKLKDKEIEFLYWALSLVVGAFVAIIISLTYFRKHLNSYIKTEIGIDLERQKSEINNYFDQKLSSTEESFTSRADTIEEKLKQFPEELKSVSESEAASASSRILGFVTDSIWIVLDNDDLRKSKSQTPLLDEDMRRVACNILNELSWVYLSKGYHELKDNLVKAQLVSNLLYFIAYSQRYSAPKPSTNRILQVETHCSIVESLLPDLRDNEQDAETKEALASDPMTLIQIELSILYVKHRLSILPPSTIRERVADITRNVRMEVIDQIRRDFDDIDWSDLPSFK